MSEHPAENVENLLPGGRRGLRGRWPFLGPAAFVAAIACMGSSHYSGRIVRSGTPPLP